MMGEDDDNHDVKHSSIYSSIGINSDFELAIRNLRPAATSHTVGGALCTTPPGAARRRTRWPR